MKRVAALALVAVGCFGRRLPEGQTALARARGLAADPPLPHRALWVWDHGVAALRPQARDQLFAFAAAHGIDTLYYDSAELVPDDPPALAGFLKAAAARSLAVELLFSSDDWVRPASREQAVSVVRAASRFAAGLTGARPTALHFDIEPYLLPEWKAGDKQRMAADYLNLLAGIEAARGRLPVHVDVPFWFASTSVVWPAGRPPRPLDQAILDIVDGCTVMDYRNRAVGGDGIVADGSRTLADADAAGKPLVIGVETNSVAPDYVTFYQLGAEAVDAQLALVDDLFEADPAFAGTAVEDYRGYRELGP